MNNALKHFKDSIERTKDTHGLFCALEDNIGRSLDITDLLRGEVVMLVSSFDYYIHELVRVGIKEVYQGIRHETIQYKNFSIPLSYHLRMKSSGNELDILDELICERHGYLSFQHHTKIADAIRLFSDAKLWIEVSLKLGIHPDDVKKQMELYIDRRNKIAHEADIKPGTFGERWPIDKKMVEDMRDFILRIGEEIYNVVIISP